MKMALVMAEESKCVSHKVGAIIVKDNRIISTGINGSPVGQLNCCDHFNEDIRPELFGRPQLVSSNKLELKLNEQGKIEHREWSLKNEIHAELNAILFAARHGIAIDGATMYTTLSPCSNSAKAISQSGIKRLIYNVLYHRSEPTWDKILKQAKIEVFHISEV